MKTVIAVLPLITSAFAQGITIASPTAGQSIAAGTGGEVVIGKPNFIMSTTDIGIAVLIHHCSKSPCEDATEDLGEIFYSGAFSPQRPPPGTAGPAQGQPFQSFFASVPQDFPKGPAVLSVPYAFLVGAGPGFVTETFNVTINIAKEAAHIWVLTLSGT